MLEDRVKVLEIDNKELWKRLEILEAEEARFYCTTQDWADKLVETVSEKTSSAINACLSNIQTIRNIIEDLQKHFESHSIDKKKERYASKRRPIDNTIYNTIELGDEVDTDTKGRNTPQHRNISRVNPQHSATPQPTQHPQHKE